MNWFADELTRELPSVTVVPGLQALSAADRQRIEPSDPRGLEGSCCLDNDLRESYPRKPRWDYALAYDAKVWFVEAHPSDSTGNVEEVMRKADWLRALLQNGRMWKRSRGLFWISTGKVTRHPAFARRRRQLAERGIRGPTSRLLLAP